MNTTIDFFNAVSSGNTDAVKAYHAEYGKMPLNTNLNWINGRIIRLPLIIAFYEGHIETARYLWENGADLDIVCRSCGKTPREFMPEGFENGSCRMMSYKVFRDRVYQAMLDNQSYPDEHATLIRLQKHESCVQEMYERATDEFCERGYTEEQIYNGLNEAGFEILAIYDDLSFEAPKEDSERVYYVVRKVK